MGLPHAKVKAVVTVDSRRRSDGCKSCADGAATTTRTTAAKPCREVGLDTPGQYLWSS